MTLERFEWIDAAGASHLLTDPVGGVYLMPPLIGRYLAPPQFGTDAIAGEDGARVREVLYGVRDLSMRVGFALGSDVDHRAAIRRWAAALDVAAGPGIFRVTGPAGDQREIPAWYVSGLEGHEGPVAGGSTTAPSPSSGTTWSVHAVTFRCFDPLWRDVADTTGGWSTGGTVTYPFFPFPRASGDYVSVSTSQIFTDAPYRNDGDARAWPVWTIVGPGSALQIVNRTTGRLLSFPNLTLAAGAVLRIDTRPNVKSITNLTAAATVFGQQTSDSSLFPLVRGDNVLFAGMANVTAQSSIGIAYRRRWLSA